MPRFRLRSSSDLHAIEVQIDVHVKAPRNGRQIPKAIIAQAVRMKADDPFHADPPGMKLRIVAWRHGDGDNWTGKNKTDHALWSDFAVFLPESSYRIRDFQYVRSR